MASITISLPEELLRRLEQTTQRLEIAPEELVRASIEDLLAQPDVEFNRAVEYVLKKNAELYRRLA